MKLLLTDAFSPLGSAISHELETETFSLASPEPGAVDWGDKDAVLAYLKQQRPDIVINSLGWSESSEDSAEVIVQRHVDAAKNLALACKVVEAVPLHLSSYRVFGAEPKSSYGERATPAPLSPGGQADVLAERHFEQTLSHWLCLRLSWLIGPEGDNLLTRLLSGLTAGEEVPVCAEMRGAPTHMADVARVVKALIKQVACGAENWGNFHYCSADACTQSEFARQVAAILEQEQRLAGRLREEDTLRPETEPASAVLQCRRCRDNFGVQPRSWRQGLHTAIKAWLRQHPRPAQ